MGKKTADTSKFHHQHQTYMFTLEWLLNLNFCFWFNLTFTGCSWYILPLLSLLMYISLFITTCPACRDNNGYLCHKCVNLLSCSGFMIYSQIFIMNVCLFLLPLAMKVLYCYIFVFCATFPTLVWCQIYWSPCSCL